MIEEVDITKNVKIDLNQILDGKSYLILKRGKAIAELNPISKKKKAWKRKINKIKLRGNISTVELIRQERDSK